MLVFFLVVFNNFKSETFNITEGIDQGDAQSLIMWLICNHQILNIFNKASNETGFLYVDDVAVLVTGKNFDDMHDKLKVVMNREGKVTEWATSHNCSFGIEKFQLLDLLQRKIRDTL